MILCEVLRPGVHNVFRTGRCETLCTGTFERFPFSHELSLAWQEAFLESPSTGRTLLARRPPFCSWFGMILPAPNDCVVQPLGLETFRFLDQRNGTPPFEAKIMSKKKLSCPELISEDEVPFNQVAPQGTHEEGNQSCSCQHCLRTQRLHLSTMEMSPTHEEKIPVLTGEQGKVAELRQELTNSGKKDKNHASKKNALKKIIANMTMSNNDMVALFPDVLACMSIENLEVKKMYVSSSPGQDVTNQLQVLPLPTKLCSPKARCSDSCLANSSGGTSSPVLQTLLT